MAWKKNVVYLPCQKYVVVAEKKGIDAIKKSQKNALHTSAMNNSHKKFLMQKIKGNMTENFSLKALVGLLDVISYKWAKIIK